MKPKGSCGRKEGCSNSLGVPVGFLWYSDGVLWVFYCFFSFFFLFFLFFNGFSMFFFYGFRCFLFLSFVFFEVMLEKQQPKLGALWWLLCNQKVSNKKTLGDLGKRFMYLQIHLLVKDLHFFGLCF